MSLLQANGALQNRDRNAHRPSYGPGSALHRDKIVSRCSAPGTHACLSPRPVSPADDWGADAVAGKFPGPGAAGILVGADDRVDQVGLAGGDPDAHRVG